jgi:hypothetical protein
MQADTTTSRSNTRTYYRPLPPELVGRKLIKCPHDSCGNLLMHINAKARVRVYSSPLGKHMSDVAGLIVFKCASCQKTVGFKLMDEPQNIVAGNIDS